VNAKLSRGQLAAWEWRREPFRKEEKGERDSAAKQKVRKEIVNTTAHGSSSNETEKKRACLFEGGKEGKKEAMRRLLKANREVSPIAGLLIQRRPPYCLFVGKGKEEGSQSQLSGGRGEWMAALVFVAQRAERGGEREVERYFVYGRMGSISLCLAKGREPAFSS